MGNNNGANEAGRSETLGNQTAGNEAVRSETVRNQTVGNEAGRSETVGNQSSGTPKNVLTRTGNAGSQHDWKEQLDRDVETLKSEINIISFRSVLNRHGFECLELGTLSIKEQALTNESVEKVVGWALSHHFMQFS
ncbi:hypothetical protein POM88_042305 [Heracleum sosnowskyi]|uniref:DUF7751 domain-containing protein n=1 Tax=Heracleum sosnowskyi TaxID=360622 RepID=A0AAD8HGH0_9APIA|nr:hypothetical protein POM88_042305 [Heracleum sosnowskyi]